MSLVFWSWIIQRNILNSISGTDYLGCSLLALGRPHSQAGQKAAVAVLEFAQCIRYIAAGNDIRLCCMTLKGGVLRGIILKRFHDSIFTCSGHGGYGRCA